MSRLESFIRRLTAQRDILDMICNEMTLPDGPVIELGLGNGRTYDHLREKLPGRRIIAFDRACAANLYSMPPEDDLVLGEISETARPFIGIKAALVHADIGSGYEPALAVRPDRGLVSIGGHSSERGAARPSRSNAVAASRRHSARPILPLQAKLNSGSGRLRRVARQRLGHRVNAVLAERLMYRLQH
jgi:hypothetical protein